MRNTPLPVQPGLLFTGAEGFPDGYRRVGRGTREGQCPSVRAGFQRIPELRLRSCKESEVFSDQRPRLGYPRRRRTGFYCARDIGVGRERRNCLWQQVDPGHLGGVVDHDRYRRLVRQRTKVEHLRLGPVHQVPVLVWHKAYNGMRTRACRALCLLNRYMDAFGTDVGNQRAVGWHTRSREAQQRQFLLRVKQRAFASQRADDESGQGRPRPLVKVMLDFDTIHGAGVIEGRRNRRIDTLKFAQEFHLTYMFSIDLDCKQPEKDLTIAELWEAGCTGIVELEEWDDLARLRVFFDDDTRQSELLARFGGESRPADLRDWVAFAREYLKPMEIGKRIFVCPEWRDDPTPPGRIRIQVNAGLAFGTGAHETTRLCLEAIERHLEPGMTVVDVGTGSGILAEAAVKLGAGRVLASDTDQEAVDVALENVEKAGVAVTVSLGSADIFSDGIADLVVANISPAWIADLAPDWMRILKPGGWAILSGFEASDVPRVSEALTKAGAGPIREFGEQEWRMLEFRRD